MPVDPPDQSHPDDAKTFAGKRLFDIAVSAVGLMLLSPLLLIPMLMICLTSPGPAIFAQQRLGRQQQRFICYKLRTMYADTPNAASHETAATAVTPFGRFLRSFKIDELPQLYNVLIGDMSLVGPRPCLPQQHALIQARQRLGVFSIRPGITGKAQVMGIDMSDPARLAEVDAAYLQERTFFGDLKVIARTLVGGGAGDRVRS